MKTFPKLYKKSSTGAIETWDIAVKQSTIVTTHGQLHGKMQVVEDTVREGKNVGRSNETTSEEQACLEAEAKWKKQVKKGYVESLDRAQKGETDHEGGVSPMLAHVFEDHGHKISFPAFIQYKLDGHRLIAVIENGKCTLWSRTRKPINSVPHIAAALEKLFQGQSCVLDGEAYSHRFKQEFEHITHILRQQEAPDPSHTDVEYHIYDVVNHDTYAQRWEWIQKNIPTDHPYLKRVHTEQVATIDEAFAARDRFIALGYEGGIIRNAAGKYKNGRSYDLQKLKKMKDGEFEIVDVEEGRGKLQGRAGAFVCKTSDGTLFKAKMSGGQDRLVDYLRNFSRYKGKMLTVQYQDLTGANKVPRFPVGLRIREDA